MRTHKRASQLQLIHSFRGREQSRSVHSIVRRRARAYHVKRFVFIASPVRGPPFIAIRSNKPCSFLCVIAQIPPGPPPPRHGPPSFFVRSRRSDNYLLSLSVYVYLYIIHTIINKTRFVFQTTRRRAPLIFSLRALVPPSSFLTIRVWPVHDNISYRDDNKRQLVQCLRPKPVDLPSRRRIADTASAHTSSVIILSANVSGRPHNP